MNSCLVLCFYGVYIYIYIKHLRFFQHHREQSLKIETRRVCEGEGDSVMENADEEKKMCYHSSCMFLG